MAIEYAALSDCGKVRTQNEDSFFIGKEETPQIFILADGMGGHNGGEVASKMLTECVRDFLRENSADATGGARGYGKLLAAAVAHANGVIFKAQSETPELCGMGTTSEVCAIWEDEFCVAHVGDSRVYLIREGEIQRITKDHSVVEMMVDNGTITSIEAKTHPQRNIITRAVGTAARIKTDVTTFDFREGDVILMCSDGLSNMMSDENIASIVTEQKSVSAAAAVLVREANEAGGNDNITVILIRRQVRA